MQDLEHRGETEAVFQLLLLFVTDNHCHGDIEIFDNIIPVSSRKICAGPEGGHHPCFARANPEGGVALELTTVAGVVSRPLLFTTTGKLVHQV